MSTFAERTVSEPTEVIFINLDLGLLCEEKSIEAETSGWLSTTT
jgi:hypothetical protein